MEIKRKKVQLITIFFLLCTIMNTFSIPSVEPLVFDRLYPETPVSRVLRTMKQLYAIMMSIKEHEIKKDDALELIIEIQSLTVCSALQELDRAIKQGFQINNDHASLIGSLWRSLQTLARDERIKQYLDRCSFLI